MVETQNLSRFRIVKPTEMMAPCKCAVCGKFSTGTYIDFGLELDFYGVVYICVEDCFTELANLQDYHSPGQHKMVMGELACKRDELNIAQDRIEALEYALDGLRRVGDFSPSSSSNAVDVEQSTQVEGSAEQGVDETEHGFVESTDEQGRPDVLHDDSIKDILGSAYDI